jgi:PAS domain-containing protein
MDKRQALLASGEAGEIEARPRRFDGEFGWFLVRGSPVRDQVGRIVKWYGDHSEVEDRKRVLAR